MMTALAIFLAVLSASCIAAGLAGLWMRGRS